MDISGDFLETDRGPFLLDFPLLRFFDRNCPPVHMYRLVVSHEAVLMSSTHNNTDTNKFVRKVTLFVTNCEPSSSKSNIK